jgi:hypothetical protein
LVAIAIFGGCDFTMKDHEEKLEEHEGKKRKRGKR